MKNRLYFVLIISFLSCLTSINLDAQHFVSASKLGLSSGEEIKQKLIFLGLDVQNLSFNDVVYYSVIYKTTGIDGAETRASGAVFIPVMDSCNSFPLISYNHGTYLIKMMFPQLGELIIWERHLVEEAI